MGIRTELTLRLPNSPGSLARVAQALADAHVSVVAMSLASTGHLHVVADNPGRAAETLRADHHHVTERDVLLVSASHRAGGLAPLLSLLRESGLNVEYAYGGGGETSAQAVVVVGVENAMRAAALTGL